MYEFIKLCGNLCINVSFYLYIHFVVMKFFKHYMKNYHSSLNNNKCDIKNIILSSWLCQRAYVF
jgi:hypothetical protein